MPQVKSLDELKALREQYKTNVDIRNSAENENKIRIAVGMATCGIAAGARETINAIVDEVKTQGLSNVSVVQTGCVGHCYAEPVVEVHMPGKEPVLYGKIDGTRGREIIQKHIIKGEIPREWVLERTGR